MQELGTATVPEIAMVKVRDGTEIAVAVYSPSGRGPFPALFAPSPYRFDNNVLPAIHKKFAASYKAAGGDIQFEIFEGAVHEWVAEEGTLTDRAREMVKAFIARQLKP